MKLMIIYIFALSPSDRFANGGCGVSIAFGCDGGSVNIVVNCVNGCGVAENGFCVVTNNDSCVVTANGNC